MSRSLSYLALALFVLQPGILSAFDDGPPIDITSPDAGSTYAHGEIKNHSLIWRAKDRMLVAVVTFTDSHDPSSAVAPDDTFFFQLPGVSLDEAKGIFTVTSAKGEVIPVAHYKKLLFIKTIEVLPNANVRIKYPHGDVTVELVAISPNDPALHPNPKDKKKDDDPDATDDGMHDVPLDKIFQ